MKHFRSLLSLGAIEDDENIDHIELNRIKSLQTSISTRTSQQRKRGTQRLSFIDGNKMKLVHLPPLHHSYSTKQAYQRQKFFYPNKTRAQKQQSIAAKTNSKPDLSLQTSERSDNTAHSHSSNGGEVILGLYEQGSNSCDVSLHLETVESPHLEHLDPALGVLFAVQRSGGTSGGSSLDRNPWDMQASHPEMETPVPSDLPAVVYGDFDAAQSAFQQYATAVLLSSAAHSAALPLPPPPGNPRRGTQVRQIHRHKYQHIHAHQQLSPPRPKLSTHLPTPFVPPTPSLSSSSAVSPPDEPLLVCSSYKAQRQRAIESVEQQQSFSTTATPPPLPAPPRPPPSFQSLSPLRQRMVATAMHMVMDVTGGYNDWLPTPHFPVHLHKSPVSPPQPQPQPIASADVVSECDVLEFPAFQDTDSACNDVSTYALRHLQHMSMLHHLQSASPAGTPQQQHPPQYPQQQHPQLGSCHSRSHSDTASFNMHLRPQNSITSIQSSVTSEAMPGRTSIHSYPSAASGLLSPIIAKHSGCLSPIMSSPVSPPFSCRPSVAPIPGSQRVHSPHLDHILSNVSELTDDDDDEDAYEKGVHEALPPDGRDADEANIIDPHCDAIWEHHPHHRTPSPDTHTTDMMAIPSQQEVVFRIDGKLEREPVMHMIDVMPQLSQLCTIHSVASSINVSSPPRFNPTLDAKASKEIERAMPSSAFRYKKLVHPQQQSSVDRDDGMSSKRTSRTVTTNMTAASTRTSTTLSLPGDLYVSSHGDDSPCSLQSAIEEEKADSHQPQLTEIDMAHALQHRRTMDIVSDSDDSEPERVESGHDARRNDSNAPFEYQSDVDDNSSQNMMRQSHGVYANDPNFGFLSGASPARSVVDAWGDDEHEHDEDGIVVVFDMDDDDDANFLLMQPVPLAPTSNSNEVDLNTVRLVEKRESNGSQILYELQSVHSASKANTNANTNNTNSPNSKQQQQQKQKKEGEDADARDGVVLDGGFSLFGDKAQRFPVSDFEAMGNLGRGAYGVVEKSFHLKSCQIVAVKRSRSPKQEMMNSFKREILICDTFAQCPFIVNMVDHGLDKKCNEYCIALEYFNKGSLSTKTSLTMLEVQHICFCILSALQVLHSQLYVHNDVKPDNILWNSDGDIVLSDFGCVKQMKDASTPLTTPCGSFAFQSHEKKFLSPIQYTTKSDIYSFGIAIAELLNETQHSSHGSPSANSPHRSEEEELVPYKLPQSVVSNYSERRDLLDFLGKCLDKNYRTRWGAAQLLAHPFVTRDYNYERSKMLFAQDNGTHIENEEDLLFMTDTLIDYYLSYNKTRDDAAATNEVDGRYFEDRSKTPIDGHVSDQERLKNMAKSSGFSSDAVLDFISKSVHDVKNRYLKL